MTIIGWLACPKCGTQHITDPEDITIWFSHDSIEQLTEVTCPKCHKKMEDKLGFESVVAFKMYGAHWKTLSERYTKLTELDIDNWNIAKELKEIGYR